MKKLVQLFCLVCFLVFTGCASILLPAKQKINIKTGNSESTVYIEDEEVGVGSNITTKVKKEGIKQLVVQTPNFKDEYICLIPHKRPTAFWVLQPLNFLNSYIGIYYDFLSTKTIDYEKEIKIPKLTEYKKKPTENKYIYLSAIKLNIKDKKKDLKTYEITHSSNIIADANKIEKQKNLKEVEKLKKTKGINKGNKKTLNTDDDKIQYDDTKFSENIDKILKKSGYIDTVNKIFSDNNNTLIIEGSINKMSEFNIYSKSIQMSPKYERIKVYTTWYIKNTYDEILDSIQSQDFSGEFYINWLNDNSTKKLQNCINDAVTTSFVKLMNNDIFTKYIKQDTNFKISEPLLTLNTPKKVVTEVTDASTASVIVKTKDGHGSGFAITEDGYILTNFHVISGKKYGDITNPKIILSTGEELTAKVVRYNRYRDIALLKVDANFEKAFKLIDTKSFKNLQEVYTIGAPKSIELGQSVSLGLISNERKINRNNLLQLSMSVNSGNSGGPLFDKAGSLHGIIISKLIGWSTEGISFAIPSYLVTEYLNIKYL